MVNKNNTVIVSSQGAKLTAAV